MKRNYDTRTTLGKIQVMQSATAGQPLQRQYRDGFGGWENIAVSDDWDWLNFDYRILPEPREWCIYIDGETGLPRWVQWKDSMVGLGIHVREVVEAR